MAEEFASNINRRKGHCVYVTKTINTVTGLLAEYTIVDLNRVDNFRRSLGEKIHMLMDLDDTILNSLTEEKQIQDVIEEVVIKREATFGRTSALFCFTFALTRP